MIPKLIQAAKRRRGNDGNGDGDGSDRISRLPDSVLHHILCFLLPKKAVHTCVLSKSWRHLGPTRPVIHLRETCCYHVRGIDGVCENCFDRSNEAFLSLLETTFQRYHHQNLSTRELRLEQLHLNSQSISVLEKWVPIMFVKPNACVNAFHISFGQSLKDLDLPSVVFRVESLRELHLEGGSLKGIVNSIVVLKNLQSLSLNSIDISDEALEKIVAGCPLVKRVVLDDCHGFKTINTRNKNIPYLSHFEFSSDSYLFSSDFYPDQQWTSIEIDVPTLQSVRIAGCLKWYRNPNNYFHLLKSLYLSEVILSTGLFENFSCNFPRLEELSLLNCSGFEEIKLYSRSIKRLTIHRSSKVDVDVPNMLYFEFSSCYLPTTFSLATTSEEWKSHLHFHCCVYDHHKDYILVRIPMLFKLIKALRHSQITLSLFESYNYKINRVEWDFNDDPVVVEHLVLDIYLHNPDSLTHFLNALFRILRPRYINAVSSCRKDDPVDTEFLWKTLIHEREKTEYGWEQHLEEVSVEASDEEGKVWHHVKWTCLSEWPRNQKIRFRLKWRDCLY